MRAWRETRGRAVRAVSGHDFLHMSEHMCRQVGGRLVIHCEQNWFWCPEAVQTPFLFIFQGFGINQLNVCSGILRDSLEVLLTGWRNTWCHVFTDKLGGMSASRFPSAHLFVNASQCVRARPRWLRRWANPSRSLCDGKTQTFPRMILKARSPVKLGSL